MYLARNVVTAISVAPRSGSELSPSPKAKPGRTQPAVAKSGITRSGSALCGVIGFQQHLGLGSAVVGGLGWLIASDHAGFLLRRRYGPGIQARVRRWQSKSRLPTSLIAPLHARVVLRGHLAKTPYRVFAVINTIGAVVWGAAFVSAGYVGAGLSHSGRPNWTDLVVVLTAAPVILGIDVVLRRRAHRSRPTPPHPPQTWRRG
ncbi:MAG: hypothetical protein QOC90_2117 [Mycobacterium sp.]|nr:hypothetical protein [Mycobacterium sp.]